MNILFTLFLIVMPNVKVETGHFNILQDGRRIGTEDFTISPRGAGYTAEGRTRITVAGQTLDVRSRMELDAQIRPTYYEVESAGNLIKLKIEQPVSELEVRVQAKTEAHDIRFPSDGAIIDDNFFHHYLLLLYRVGTAGINVPTLVPQQRTVGNLTIRPIGNRMYELESPNIRMTATTDQDGRLMRLTVPDAKVVVER